MTYIKREKNNCYDQLEYIIFIILWRHWEISYNINSVLFVTINFDLKFGIQLFVFLWMFLCQHRCFSTFLLWTIFSVAMSQIIYTLHSLTTKLSNLYYFPFCLHHLKLGNKKNHLLSIFLWGHHLVPCSLICTLHIKEKSNSKNNSKWPKKNISKWCL